MYLSKKLILTSTLLLSFSALADDYVGYGKTQEAAREDLAQNILSTIKTETVSETQSIRSNSLLDFLKPSFLQSTKHSSKHSTNIILTNIKIEKNTQNEGDFNGGFIARLDKKQFKQDAESTIQNVEKSCNGNFPDTWDARRKALDKCLIETGAAIGMAGVAVPKKVENLTKLHKGLEDLAAKAEVSIASTPNASFNIGSLSKAHNDTVRLDAGNYTVVWKKEGYCRAEQKFNVKPGDSLKVTQKLYRLPTVTIKSANESDHITLDTNKGRGTLQQGFSQCEGSINYTVSNGNLSKTGSIKLKPGLDRTVNVNLLTQSDIRDLKSIADSFTKLNQYNLIYAYSHAEDFEGMHRIKLENIKSKSALRYGVGALYGKGEGDAREYEGYVQLALQLTHIGEVPLHLGSWAVIPYAGAELGVGYHERYNAELDEKFHNYGEEKDFAKDYLSLRYLVGFDFPVNPKFSIKAQFSKNTRNAEDVEGAIGASLQF